MIESKRFPEALGFTDSFVPRHIGPSEAECEAMLRELKLGSLDELVDRTVPRAIRAARELRLPAGATELEALAEIRTLAAKNRVFKTYLGMGYSDCFTPPVIQRNILENPGWYTQYTPYQSEIAQGRLEALLNFQTMVIDLTGLPVANASLLDEGTAAAEAMNMAFNLKARDLGRSFFMSDACHPQSIEVVRTRAEALGISLVVGDHRSFAFDKSMFGALLQYPGTDGEVSDYSEFIRKTHDADAIAVVAADLLSLMLLKSPGELGADIAVGRTQRFGVPMGFGGPHAAFFTCKDEHKRLVPGRLVGVSQDAEGKPAVRLALQTREQHIRRDKATSNICTAQVLLAIISSMYAVYHGPTGLRRIAERVHLLAEVLRAGLRKQGYAVSDAPLFDTVRVPMEKVQVSGILSDARSRGINLRQLDAENVGVALDETTSPADLETLLDLFGKARGARAAVSLADLTAGVKPEFPSTLARKSPVLRHPVFNRYHSETEMLRYLARLQRRDLSLTTSMIPLGSCTMKLNATAEMFPVTWPEFGKLHPFAPSEQTEGYQELTRQLESMLGEITGFDGVSLQPNAGSQGEYAGLLVIRRYHHTRGEKQRDVCLIPRSAHGTNPASAALAGLRVVVVECDDHGNVDLADLRAKAKEHGPKLSSLMVTYPSTHGVFEEAIREICEIVHAQGGQVYMDGANMNAQIGLCRPGEFGPDVCHLNLHKTFCIPHGGGGPGMGPICVKAHLKPFLPGHPLVKTGGAQAMGPISAAPWGSASILPISWMYIRMMGPDGLKRATQVAILNANYIAQRLSTHFPVLYRGQRGLVAHECIFDLRQFKAVGVEVEDVAKRLMDFGFHAPTISFPVAGTMMVEPTESESKRELDRFCEAMITIRAEIEAIVTGKSDRADNPLKNAPHTAGQVAATEWKHPYSREVAAFPLEWVREDKFWPAVARINNVLGDRNFVCACPPVDDYV